MDINDTDNRENLDDLEFIELNVVCNEIVATTDFHSLLIDIEENYNNQCTKQENNTEADTTNEKKEV